MRSLAALNMTAALTLAAASAPLAGHAETVRPGEASDSIGLGLIGHETPEVLKHAKADPYAAPAAPACETIPHEIAALDEVLGPDADTPAQKTKMRARANRLISQALRSTIPHRDVVRFVTGADRRDKALNQAAMAGWARRGFLKGMEVNLGCPGHAQTAQAADHAAEPAVAHEAVVHAVFPYEAVAVHQVAVTTQDAQIVPASTTSAVAADAPASAPATETQHHSRWRSVSDAIVGPVKDFVR
jgi:hypothetical protein